MRREDGAIACALALLSILPSLGCSRQEPLGTYSLDAGNASGTGDSMPPDGGLWDARVLSEHPCPCVAGMKCGLSPGGGDECTDSGAWAVFVGQAPPACPSGKDLVLPGGQFQYRLCAYSAGACDGPLDWYEWRGTGPWMPVAAQDLCEAQCPSQLPPGGGDCGIEGLACQWPSACGAAQVAFCQGGRWQVTVNPCGCADPARFTFDAPCISPGLTCLEIIDGTFTRLSSCQSGAWHGVIQDPGPCPLIEPAANDSCPDGSSCDWPNPCGTATYGSCMGGVWTKSPSPCPGTALTSCTEGTPCEPRVSCSKGCTGDSGPPIVDCKCGPDLALHCVESAAFCPVSR